MKEITLQEMLSTIIGELRKNGRWGTAHIYQSTLNVFRIQQLSEFASAQTEFSGFKTF